jgi:hypothetical protein
MVLRLRNRRVDVLQTHPHDIDLFTPIVGDIVDNPDAHKMVSRIARERALAVAGARPLPDNWQRGEPLAQHVDRRIECGSVRNQLRFYGREDRQEIMSAIECGHESPPLARVTNLDERRGVSLRRPDEVISAGVGVDRVNARDWRVSLIAEIVLHLAQSRDIGLLEIRRR